METLRMILALPILTVVLTIAIWLFMKWFGKVSKRIEKIEFNHDFNLLKMCVECSEVNEPSFNFILNHFNDIYLNPERDNDKLEKLSKDFEYKFRGYFNEIEKPISYSTTDWIINN